MAEVGVLLLNLGGPDKQEDVRPFLYNLFADPEIIRIPVPPLQKPLAWLISTLRAPKSRKNYQAIGGGSPLRAITNQQGRVLKKALAARGLDIEVYVGMRYWHPFTEEAVRKIKADGIRRLVLLPLYPQYSISTSGSSFKLLDQIWARDPSLKAIERITINSWYSRPGYIRAMGERVREGLDKFDNPDGVHILFSAHGVPRTYVDQDGDPYQRQTEETVDLVMQSLGRPNAHSLAYQSRVGPVEWLKPYTEDTINELAQKGVRSLLAVPVSFISEHIETLQEIEIEYREVAEAAGIHDFRRAKALNVNKTFIDDLAEMVIENLGVYSR
ncbi:ferrochelatase [Gloeobacter violaceus]|uniref:Ferrochelatase n=1 Tax=Gloeobacter violaceus (strain ATCC 29082 / PCC 7421) TaxID=251221 RepID=HEMH_GLOVI|nr:ferrochelatase [Gloeobacter violaceus]Q7NMC7.1 RecName: Full=Ferrochelatase; AltName: Full=Heme synthase; AltName: Full=Protoheme ferro-lyase [Gloeobacter violaceus PCC 7421]BAC88780.1 ferrochelatase [Gloeobacter violaceus PCC 7421]